MVRYLSGTLSVFGITSYSLGNIVYVRHEANVCLMSSLVVQLSNKCVLSSKMTTIIDFNGLSLVLKIMVHVWSLMQSDNPVRIEHRPS